MPTHSMRCTYAVLIRLKRQFFNKNFFLVVFERRCSNNSGQWSRLFYFFKGILILKPVTKNSILLQDWVGILDDATIFLLSVRIQLSQWLWN